MACHCLYARDEVTCLFAALNTATGQVTDACYPNQFLEFVKERRRLPATESHVVCDNYATHKHAEVRK